MAVITSIAVAGAAAAASSAMKAKADKKSAQDANNANLTQYQQSRGAGGNAILPMYADPGTEKRLFDQAVAESAAMAGGRTPQEIYAEYQQILAGMQPSIDAGNEAIGDIYNGNMLRDTLAFQQPVMDARTGMAVSNRDAINLAVRAEANRINAEEARKGYSGAGSFANNRLLDASILARQRAAGGVSAAVLANAEDEAGIRRSNQSLKLSALDLAPNRAAQLIRLDQAPAEGVAAMSELRTKPLNFFRLQVGQPPTVRPVPQTGAGQLALQAVGQAAGAYGSYEAQGRAANEWGASTNPPSRTRPYVGTGEEWQSNPIYDYSWGA